MEAASTLTRSLSLSPSARTARFPSPNHCLFSSTASPCVAPLCRTKSDLTASAVLLRPSPILPVLESPVEEHEEACHLLDGARAGRNGGAGGHGGRGGRASGSSNGCGMGEYYRRVLRVDPERDRSNLWR